MEVARSFFVTGNEARGSRPPAKVFYYGKKAVVVFILSGLGTGLPGLDQDGMEEGRLCAAAEKPKMRLRIKKATLLRRRGEEKGPKPSRNNFPCSLERGRG